MELEINHQSGPNPVNDDIAAGSSPTEEHVSRSAEESRPVSANLMGTAAVIPANAIRVVPDDGVVRLPAGTRLDAIRLSGSHLIVTLPDGQVMVIMDGALHVPQIVLGRISIPATNIAALIAGQEPEPAAGAPQSSGGNFVETPGTIGDPFGLGDLLAPTEFGFAKADDSSFLPNVPDHKPEVLIFTTDQPLGSIAATATVSEAALAARGAEAAGSDPSSSAETVTGVIQFASLDLPYVIAVNGTAITAVGQTVATPLGLITITSIAPGEIGYSYTLVDNATDPNATEVITITVTDGDNDIAMATLTLSVTDDAPTANADTDDIEQNSYTAHTGNVITGTSTTSGPAGVDIAGADGAVVSGVHSAITNVFSAAGTFIAGKYGHLLLQPNGSYTYVRDAGSPGGVTDVFTYRLTDGNGDTSMATLTFNIEDSDVNLGVPSAGEDGTFVDEAGLSERGDEPPGSRDGDGSTFTVGTINFDAPDGPAIITINGVVVTGEGQEIEMETGTLFIIELSKDTLQYLFVLNDNVIGVAPSQPVDVTVTDQDGDTVSSSFAIDILDDTPTAVDDNDTLQAGRADGNVLTGVGGSDANTSDGVADTPGADGASVTGISFDGNVGVIGAATAGAYGALTMAADGGYLYTVDKNNPAIAGLSGDQTVTEIFTYTITDGDGDEATAMLSITIHGENDVVTISGINAAAPEVMVSEANLPDGSSPSADDLIKTGSFSFDAPDGVASITIGGQALFNGTIVSGLTINSDHGILTITGFDPVTDAAGEIVGGTISYSYELLANTVLHTGANGTALTETFAISIVDADGSTATSAVDVVVGDDSPVALSALAITMAENAPAISGNLLEDDTSSADGVRVTSVNVGGVVLVISATETTTYTNAIGTYTFEAGGEWTFDPVSVSSAAPVNASFSYTIADGDGDQSTAQQQITVTDGANPVASGPITLVVDDQNLETGSTPTFLQPVATSGEIHFTPGSDAITSIIFGDMSGLHGGLVWTHESDTQIIGWYTDIPVITLDLMISGTTATVKATLDFNYPLHPGVTADDIANLGSISVVAVDTDGDKSVGTVNISVSDDVPTISTIGSAEGMLVVDESNLAANATANFASLFNVAMGADRYGTVSYTFDVTKASGLIDVATGEKIILQAMGNVVEGRLATSVSTVAFRLSIAADGTATLDQMRSVQHANPGNPDDTVSLSSTLIRLFATVTDADGDKATAFVLVGDALVFRDDGPSIHVSVIDNNSILLTTQDGDTRGAAFDVASADLSSSFTAATSFGADGAGNAGQVSWVYALALGSASASTGLSSDGVPITLALVAGTVVGSAGGSPIFSVVVNASTGVVTLTQFAEIDHSLPGSANNYAGQLVELAANLIELRGTATIVDRDGDSISDTIAVDLGGNIRFSDDGPSLSATGDGPVLVVDETNFYVNATANLSSLFQPTLDFGADGPGSVAYALGVTAGPSGLADSLTGEAIILSIVNGVVYGKTSTHEAFRISVAPGGDVTFDQSRAIMHGPNTGPDQIKYLLGSNLITLTATATDGDGDMASSTADITGHFGIRDDAPTPDNDEDNVARDGQTFADGNVLTGLGGTDANGADGSPDNAGADGGLHVSGVAFAATTGTLGSALAGEYGFLTLAADGSYRYELDLTDPAVAALSTHQTLTDTFTYTVKDVDGDSATATITISITGGNDFPIARADTNWVLDGTPGSDPAAFGNVLQNIAHPGAPSGSFADVADNDPNLEPISVTTAGTYVGLYGTLVIAADGAYTYTLNEDNVAVNALNAGQTLLDSFFYTISDGLLSVESSLSITVFGTNDAPTFGTSIARISEEGLAGGVADTAPNATLDTTNSTTFSGTLATADPDAGQTLTATLGDPGAVLTAGGVPVTWTGIGTGTLIGSAGTSEVIRITLSSDGAYTVTLSKGVDHANVTTEDLKEFNIPVSVFDGTATTTNSAAIHIVIEDDAPNAFGEAGSSSQPQQDVNTLFILDFSASIDETELDVMLSAVKSALTQLDVAASGDLGIGFVIFSSGSFASPSFTTVAAANLYLDSLNPAAGGERPSQAVPPEGIGLNTNYSGAIQTALAHFAPVSGASNQVFFLSDGNPNQQVQFGGFPPSVINSLTPTTATAWNNFVDNNGINVTAIGIDNNPLQPLNIQRLQDVDLNDSPNNHPILVADFEALVSTLLSVIVPSAVSGDLDLNDAYGADGGHILSIMVGAITYMWDGASSIAVSTGGTIAGTSLTAIATPMGAALTFNFATGQYYYQPPIPITVTATEVFSYTLIDKDGDTATASLSITITAVAPPVVLDLDGDGVEFVSSAAGVHFDYNGDGVAESTAWVGRDDGLLVIDKNSDGKIDTGSELVFGHDGLTDLQGLAADYDSNKDGKLDASDTTFSQFVVWRDADGDGVTDAGELQSLTTAGIASISLISGGRGYLAADGQVVVKGEGVFVRADGSTGRLADAAFAINFANEPQRALSAATNGISTALLAAGLVAAAPVAAHVQQAPPSPSDVVPEMQAASVDRMVEPTSVERAAEWGMAFDDADDVLELSTADIVSGPHHFDDHESLSAERIEVPEAASSAPSFSALLERTADEPVQDKVHHGSFAAPVDQAVIMPAMPQPATGLTDDGIKAMVANAIEGRTVDLDALLGANPAPEHVLPQIQLNGEAGAGFAYGGDMPALGNLFMPDMAEQHIMAQMEQAAVNGHA